MICQKMARLEEATNALLRVRELQRRQKTTPELDVLATWTESKASVETLVAKLAGILYAKQLIGRRIRLQLLVQTKCLAE